MTKKPYSSIEIRELGTIAELTQGGGNVGAVDGVNYQILPGVILQGLSGAPLPFPVVP